MKIALSRMWFIPLILSIACQPAFASEGNTFGGPVGGTDIRNAYLPSASGFYGGVVAAEGAATRYYGDNGAQNSAINVNVHLPAAALGLMYVYPFTLWGGTLASSVQAAYATGNIELNNRRTEVNGMQDLYSEIIAWSKYLGPIGAMPENAKPGLPYGLTVKLAYSMLFPTGKYNTTDLIAPGHNVFYFIPNFAFSYLTGPNLLGDGLELSAHVFLDISSTNHTTHYSSGPVGDIDVALSERMGRWQVGVGAYYAAQWEDDVRNGTLVAPNGKHLVSAGVGPIIAYDIPAWKASVKLKAQFPVYQRNYLGASRFFLIFSKAL